MLILYIQVLILYTRARYALMEGTQEPKEPEPEPSTSLDIELNKVMTTFQSCETRLSASPYRRFLTYIPGKNGVYNIALKSISIHTLHTTLLVQTQLERNRSKQSDRTAGWDRWMGWLDGIAGWMCAGRLSN